MRIKASDFSETLFADILKLCITWILLVSDKGDCSCFGIFYSGKSCAILIFHTRLFEDLQKLSEILVIFHCP